MLYMDRQLVAEFDLIVVYAMLHTADRVRYVIEFCVMPL